MTIESVSEAQMAMTDIYVMAKLEAETPEEILEELKKIFLIPIQPQAISEFGEYIFAREEDFSSAVKTAASEVVDFATSMAWWGLTENSRGSKISKLLKGQSITGEAPAPLTRFRPVDSNLVVPPIPPAPPEE